MHFCGSAIFSAVSILNERHIVVLEVNSAALFLFQDTLKCEYYLVSCALQRLTWTSCLAIWSEIIHVNSQSQAVDLWKNETSDGKQKEIARSRNNLSRKIQIFFELPLFSSNSSEGLVRKSKITGTPEENEDIYSVVHRSVSDPFVPIHRRIRKESFEPMINASSFSFDHNKEAM